METISGRGGTIGVTAPRGSAVPVVGIGASAGGLEALQPFFARVSVPSGRAFVVVQHMDPDRQGLLVDLLQGQTGMSVKEAVHLARVEPDHVYVIPPGRDLSLVHGLLHVSNVEPRTGPAFSIDTFFRSLALDQGEQATGVVLSGMGTDGTLGLRSIKERGGLAMVQEPTSARFDSMPLSALASVAADVVAPPGELAVRLPPPGTGSFPTLLPAEPLGGGELRALDEITHLLRRQSGSDFTLYKRSTLLRRIERRMGLQGISSLPEYCRLLQNDPQEGGLLFRELLIGVTSFFRDPVEWDRLAALVIPELVAATPKGGTIRAWVPACSTGEEAYSLAILVDEALRGAKRLGECRVQIFATDLDEDAVKFARAGVFPASVAMDMVEDRVQRNFIREGDRLRVIRQVRECVIFAAHNLIQSPPFARLNLISCRNLLIYLEPVLQHRLFPLFHHCLLPGGFLFLGNAETVGGQPGLFESVGEKTRIYRRRATALDTPSSVFPVVNVRTPRDAPAPIMDDDTMDMSTLLERLILDALSPAAVVVGEEGDILHVHGQVGPYLEPAAGKANLNVHFMAREGLRVELSAALRAVRSGKETAGAQGLVVNDGATVRVVDLDVRRLGGSEDSPSRFVVAFWDRVPDLPTAMERSPEDEGAGPPDVEKLRAELQQAGAELQRTREEMQASKEDLLSLNEELQSSNEELQATNEELLASKEEMQALNEELQAVNSELEAKVHEFGRAEDDMRNLLNSTDIATVFLDTDLRIRRYTTSAAGLIRLIPGDVGRPITDVTSDLDYPELVVDAREVVETLVPREREVRSTGERWFTARIRPYRTVDNRIDGVVLTFTDVSKLKATEAHLRVVQAKLETRLSEDHTGEAQDANG